MFSLQKNVKTNTNTKDGNLLASVLRLQISRPVNYDWKKDYAEALGEKYARIH
ncbi:MAG: hypothetical protein FWE23_05025 [Chitinivibrionia bacterium]|nr:hypothetical protein [Chitinivibrionia bacterium]